MHAVVFDLETTGFSPESDAIVEIGAIVVRDGVVRHDERFHTLVHPGRRIPWYVTKVHGINDAAVRGAPSIDAVLPAFLEFVGGRTLVAHNAGFDMSFLRANAARLGLLAPHAYECTMELSRRAFPRERRHNLDAVCDRLGLQAAARHRALDDAEVTAEAFVRLVARLAPVS